LPGGADGLGTIRFGGFPAGGLLEPPDVPEGFVPRRFGGTDILPAAIGFVEATGVTFAFGEPLPGFTKFGGVFCPAPEVGETVAPGDAGAPGDPVAGPWLPIRRFTKEVDFGKSFGVGFCSAIVFLSFSASWGLTPRHPFST
jgi:hypothetical protein